ncbi:hypothetical protein ACM42_05260 [Bradyrhizobium sp. CCBAU 25338]|nr:hypothetical protein [Bradyrhizobium sp. CCBAU 25338]
MTTIVRVIVIVPRAMENCPLILAQMTMLPKRTLVSPESAAASLSGPLAKRGLQGAVASERLASIRPKNL